ncbi:MAG: hypothetical protein LBD06_11315 [Candidatus Accumulibacter sp.]|nr:hypothetical protein [Accumulibacter sp.]
MRGQKTGEFGRFAPGADGKTSARVLCLLEFPPPEPATLCRIGIKY